MRRRKATLVRFVFVVITVILLLSMILSILVTIR